jgi:integrase
MAWVEHTSGQHWRVRYRSADVTVTSEGGFTTPPPHTHPPKRSTSTNTAALSTTPPADAPPSTSGCHAGGPPSPSTRPPSRTTTTSSTHITPRFGHIPLGELQASDVTSWTADLHTAGYQHSTIVGIVSLFRRILGDAVEDGLLPANPMHPHRNRSTRAFRIHHEMLWASPEEILRGAQQAEQLHNRTSALLIVTAAWTGCRWGELAALQRHNTHPDDRTIVIDPDIGALKETAHRQWLGSPKTPASARTITLPAFLAVLLKHHLASHDHPTVFASDTGGFLWRHTWRTRVFNPAFDGNLGQPHPTVRLSPIRPGLTFHELRHSQ